MFLSRSKFRYVAEAALLAGKRNKRTNDTRGVTHIHTVQGSEEFRVHVALLLIKETKNTFFLFGMVAKIKAHVHTDTHTLFFEKLKNST